MRVAKRRKKQSLNTVANVYASMLRQVCRDYAGGIGDWRTLTLDEIEWFYDGLRPELKITTDV